MGCAASDWNGSRLGGDDLFVDTWVYWHLGAFFAWAPDFVFRRWCSLVDAQGRFGGGVVDLCGARRFADFVSGV